MKLNKRWCIVFIMILVIVTTVPVFAESAESGGFLRQIFRTNPKTMILGIAGGALGVGFSFLKGKDSRKRK